MAKMTNEQIIFNARIQLMEAGLIGTTGRKIEIADNNGEVKEINEPEEIHTVAGWNREGYLVRKGEKAKISIPIWNAKYIGDKEDPNATMFMVQRNAYFFAPSQVEPMPEQPTEETEA